MNAVNSPAGSVLLGPATTMVTGLIKGAPQPPKPPVAPDPNDPLALAKARQTVAQNASKSGGRSSTILESTPASDYTSNKMG
jgi:hypothetical protein